MATQLTVVDFNADEVSEETLTIGVNHLNGTVDDWMEKDYGLKVFVSIPDANVAEFKSFVRSLNNFELDD